jgi:hypothetical protein
VDPDAIARAQADNLLHAAAFLAARAEFVVVGGCALRLHGRDRIPPDLDLVPEPSPANLRRLFDGLTALGTVGQVWRPNDHALATRDIMSRTTPVGVIDVLLEHGREEYAAFERRALTVPVNGREVRVAAVDDVLELRARFGKVVVDA